MGVARVASRKQVISRERAREPHQIPAHGLVYLYSGHSRGRRWWEVPRVPHLSLDLAASRILWLPGIDARNWNAIEPLLRGSSGDPISPFRPVCLGFAPFQSSRDLGRRSGI